MEQGQVVKILEVLGAENIKDTGNGYLMCSCLHTNEHAGGADNNPSMWINCDEPVRYKCRSCGSGWTLKYLIQEMEKLHKKDYSTLLKYVETNDSTYYSPDWETKVKNAVKKVEFTCKIVSPHPRFIPLIDYEKRKVKAEAVEGVRYLRGRNISWEAIDKAKLLYDPYERRVVFPVLDTKGDCYGYTSRSIIDDKDFPRKKIKCNKQWDFGNKHSDSETCDPFYINEKGKRVSIHYDKVRDYKGLKKSQLILGQHLWKRNLPVFIVEGLFGYLHLLSIGAGEHFNIGCVMGATLSAHQAQRIVVYGKPTFLLFDNDEAGQLALHGTENSAGAIDKLNNRVILCIPKWPRVVEQSIIDRLTPIFLKISRCEDRDELKSLKKQVDGYTMRGERLYKADPDKLTIEDIINMKQNTEIQ